MKKLFCLILALSFCLFAGCGEGEPAQTEPAISVEQKVLFEMPYAKVSSETIAREGEVYILDLAFQNSGTEDIGFSDEVVCVNGLSVPFTMEYHSPKGGVYSETDEMPAREGGTMRLYIDCASMFLWGMDKVETIDIHMGLHTQYSHDTLSATLQVEEAGTNGTLSLDGETILEQDGITVQYKIVDNWPAYLLVNRTEYPVMVKTSEMTFNGFSEYYSLNPDWIWAEPGQSIVSVPRCPDGMYVPTADTLEVGFQVRVLIDGDGKTGDDIYSKVATYEAPFFINNYGLHDDFYEAYEDENFRLLLGSQQTSYEDAEDLCLWIENKTDQEVKIYVTEVTIDGREIPVYESDKTMDQCFFYVHSVYAHSKEIQSLTYGECGTPEMYGGIQEVTISFTVELKDGNEYGLGNITVPFA